MRYLTSLLNSIVLDGGIRTYDSSPQTTNSMSYTASTTFAQNEKILIEGSQYDNVDCFWAKKRISYISMNSPQAYVAPISNLCGSLTGEQFTESNW